MYKPVSEINDTYGKCLYIDNFPCDRHNAVEYVLRHTFQTINRKRVVRTGFGSWTLEIVADNKQHGVNSYIDFSDPGDRILFNLPIYCQSRSPKHVIACSGARGSDVCLRGRPRNDGISVHGEPIFFFFFFLRKLKLLLERLTASTAFLHLSLFMLSAISVLFVRTRLDHR